MESDIIRIGVEMLEYFNDWINTEKNPVKKIVKKILYKLCKPILKVIDRFEIMKSQELKLYRDDYLERYRNLILIQEKLQLSINDYENKLKNVSQNQYEMASKLESFGNIIEEQKLETSELEEKITNIENVAREDYSCIDYFDFENKFRGSIEDIKNRQKIYLPYFREKHNVYDLGCGRGEFVELLQENHIGITGVDLYLPFVEFCQSRNLNVVYGDALKALKNVESVDGVFLGQLIEHISTKQLVEILTTAYDKLGQGCYLIAETPNPVSLAIYTRSFYIDPSHNKPVHPLTLQYLVEKAGFRECEIIFTEGSRVPVKIPSIVGMDEFNESMKIVSDTLFGSQDYALIARK